VLPVPVPRPVEEINEELPLKHKMDYRRNFDEKLLMKVEERELEGGIYTGQVKIDNPNIKHGLGILRRNDNSVYEGMFKDNKTFGRGKQTHENGDVYKG
jgi:hypothetical protein